MNQIVIERLRLRGDHAARLTRVASTTLPAALDRALADLSDVRIEMLPISLDLDPRDYDDATLATLWADAIRHESLAAGATLRSPAMGEQRTGTRGIPVASGSVSDTGMDSSTSEPSPGSDPRALATALHLWRDAGAPVAAIPRFVAARFHEVAWKGADSPLSADDVSLLVRRVLPLATQGLMRPHLPLNPSKPSEKEPAFGREHPAHTTGGGGDARSGISVEVAAKWLSRVAAMTDPNEAVVDLRQVSAVGGLVLLYPWLAAYCARASEELPDVEPLRARAGALSVLATGSFEALDDPLTGLLAGGDPGSSNTGDLTALLTPPALAHADGLLTRFAALLPGFAESTPAFVRESWIMRLALVDTAATPAHVYTETAPLDILLPTLPYPLTGFRLPWTGVILVRFSP